MSCYLSWKTIEKKSSHCVFACTFTADYSILHEMVCYFLYNFFWVMGLCHPSDRYHKNQHVTIHTPSITFQHLPPNSARFSYVTEGALFISAQLSTSVVSTLWKVWVLIWLEKPKHACEHEAHPPRVKKEFRPNSNNSDFICAGVRNMVSYKTNIWYNLSCL